MDREKLFEEFLNECKKQICGQGNPNADILIIGQEPASKIDLNNPDNYTEYLAAVARNHNLCRDKELRDGPRPKRNEHTGKINTTWQNYQRLINRVYHRESEFKDKFDFEKYAFTTELNNKARQHSSTDNKTMTSIKDRLNLLKESHFIQSFPVIILACGPYIKNVGEGAEREIDNNFEVEFKELNTKYSSKVWFSTHLNRKETEYFKIGEKLVIHTRQFGRIIPNLFLDYMAEEIRKHLKIE